MNNLKRELAPLSAAAWHEVDAEAARVLKLKLAGRKLVDFEGPLGPAGAAVNTGRREASTSATGAAPSRSRRPVFTAAPVGPSGPSKSTSFRPASFSRRTRVASASISCHAAVDSGASSRLRLFTGPVLP